MRAWMISPLSCSTLNVVKTGIILYAHLDLLLFVFVYFWLNVKKGSHCFLNNVDEHILNNESK